MNTFGASIRRAGRASTACFGAPLTTAIVVGLLALSSPATIVYGEDNATAPGNEISKLTIDSAETFSIMNPSAQGRKSFTRIAHRPDAPPDKTAYRLVLPLMLASLLGFLIWLGRQLIIARREYRRAPWHF